MLSGSSSIQEGSIVAAVDLPGYGGTDGLERYGATQVLEKITQFIIALREEHGILGNGNDNRRVIIVGHDWGAVIAFRLATEAPQLADRFIMTNGPLAALMKENVLRATISAYKMLRTFLKNPFYNRSLVYRSISTLKPVISQLISSGYAFVFQLPESLIRTIGRNGDYFFLKAVHKTAAGTVGEYTIRDAQESLASTLGPGVTECQTLTNQEEGYSSSVKNRQSSGNFFNTTAYYRDGIFSGTWHKSLQTISALHSILPGEPRRTSSGAGVFDEVSGTLQANATIIWGKNDHALVGKVALEGIADYLVHESQVIVLPRTGHFTPIEVESRAAIQKVVEWAIDNEREDVGTAVASVYHGASVTVRK